MKSLQSNTTGTEDATSPYGVTTFNSNGFSLNDTSSGAYGVNGGSGGTYSGTPPNYVAWQWRASNATAVSNTAGSITSTVSANTSAGFSVVTYTGNGNAYPTGATVGHGLGIAPSMVIIKSRSTASTFWPVYHISTGATSHVVLNTYFAASATDAFNRTNPTSTVFSIGQNTPSNETNANGATYVAYCFSEIAGYSKFGSYTGNNSTDGPFVYCGFRPKFILWKNTTGLANNWKIQDTSRSPTNAAFQTLAPDNSDAEGANTVSSVDFVSNGFKIRGTASDINQGGQTIIFMAFAESPFKYANAR
jgi:hypothetical protein